MRRDKPKVVDCIFQEQEINRHVGTRIRERRVMLGLTQQQIAELIGVTSQQEYKYEAGLNSINVGWLPALADALHVDISFFFEGMGQRAKAPKMQERFFLEFARNFAAISDPKQQEALAALARSMVPNYQDFWTFSS